MSDYLEELLQLQDSDGLLKPQDVVDRASDPNSAMHSKFDWEDSVCGNKWRLHQARQLIRTSVTVLDQAKDEKPIRTYVSLNEDRTKTGGGYRPLARVMSNEALRVKLLAQAKGEAIAWRNRYQTLIELSPIFSAIDVLCEQQELETS